MANRGMSAAMLTEIAKPQVRLIHLIKLGLSVEERFTDAYKDIVYNSESYDSLGHLISIGEVKESVNLRVNSISITLSGVDQSFIATFLSQNITNKTITIYMGFLDSGGNLISSPVEKFTGKFDNYRLSEDTLNGTSEIKLTAANHWIDWEKTAGRRTNDEDQQLYFPGDNGLEFTSFIIKDLKWGKND